ncbi:MAG: hypothetical protein KKG88_10895 [Proteobacteria bacterium]|nr:hypothetical protein [Pseudomonadota bacterium]
MISQKPYEERALEQPHATKGRKSQNSAAAALRFRLSSPGYVKAAHQGGAEAVIKVASFARGFQARLIMDYIGRTDKEQDPEKPGQEIELENQYGEIFKGKDEIQRVYEEWANDFGKAKPGTKRPPRDATHIVFSAGADNTQKNRNLTLLAAQEVAREHFANKGYDYMMGLHQDADKPHVHFVVRNHHREKGGKKFKLNPADLFVIRAHFARALREVGLDHVSTLQRDRPKTTEEIKEEIDTGIKRLRKKENWLRIQIEKKAPDTNAFKHREAILDTVTRLNEQIKKITTSKSPERAALMGETRKIKRALLKSEPDLQTQIESTVRGLGKDALRYRELINELTNPTPKAPAIQLAPQELESRKKYLAGLEKRTARDIDLAREAIKNSDGPLDERGLALDALRKHERLMKGVSIDKETDKLLDRMAKDVEKFGEHLKELRNPVSGELPRSAVERIQNRRILEKQAQAIERTISQAQKSVRLTPISPKVKEAAQKVLKQHQQTISRSLGRSAEKI